MNKESKINLKLISGFIILVIIIVNYAQGFKPSSDDYINHWKCNYSCLSLNTNIHATDETGRDVTIKGNVFRVVTDPLTMKDKNGTVIGYAGDTYNFVTQDSHGIYTGNTFCVNVDGKFKFFGDEYSVLDGEGKKIAEAKFNVLDTKGKLYSENTLIAEYISKPLRKDYEVYIYENTDVFSDDSIMLIFASYVSDKSFDERSSMRSKK